jgi:predicted DNA-binding transcriptional regulator AlpA
MPVGFFMSEGNHMATAKLKATVVPLAQPATEQAIPRTIPTFDNLPDTAMIRALDLIRSPKRPTAETPIPFSAATLWRKVRSGEFPAPSKLSEGVTAWRVGDVRAWLNAKQTGSVA